MLISAIGIRWNVSKLIFLEVSIMKRYLISTIVVLAVLVVVMAAFGQGDRPGGMRGGMGREEQQKAIAAIEAQLAKLKKGMEAPMPRPEGGFQDMSEEERTKFREAMMKRREEQAAIIEVIEQQVMILKGGRQLASEHDEAMAELQAIHAQAVKENATETAKSIQALIDKRTKKLEDTVEKLGIRLRRGRGMGGPGQGPGPGGRRGQEQQ
jgi:hypothetical protein